jgi:hypothetical protein
MEIAAGAAAVMTAAAVMIAAAVMKRIVKRGNKTRCENSSAFLPAGVAGTDVVVDGSSGDCLQALLSCCAGTL